MHRLIVQLKEPLNASFCEAVVILFGECGVIPMTEDYCVLEGFKIENSITQYEKIIQFSRQHTFKAFLTDQFGDLELQIQKFIEIDYCGLYSENSPPIGF